CRNACASISSKEQEGCFVRPFSLHMDLSRQRVPRYLELAQTLRDQLCDYQVGEYLPAETELAERFGVNRHTLRRAVDELIAEGRVLRRKGRGTCILPQPVIYPVHPGSAYSKTLQNMGFQSEALLLGKRERPAIPGELKDLQLHDEESVLELQT